MAFTASLAGEVSDFDPFRTSPDDITAICGYARTQLNRICDHTPPESDIGNALRRIITEINTIDEAACRQEVRASWETEGQATTLLERLSQLENQAYDAFLAGVEQMDSGNPLAVMARQYQQAVEMKRQGRAPGVIQY